MEHEYISGYNPDTDWFYTDAESLLIRNIVWVPVIRLLPNGRRLKLVMPYESFITPEPHEFLWAPRKALGILDVWWSVANSVDIPGGVEVTFQTGEASWRQWVGRDAVQDDVAWQAIQRQLFASFLVGLQRKIDNSPDGSVI